MSMKLFAELKRRKAHKVGPANLVVDKRVIQMAATTAPPLNSLAWAQRTITFGGQLETGEFYPRHVMGQASEPDTVRGGKP